MFPSPLRHLRPRLGLLLAFLFFAGSASLYRPLQDLEAKSTHRAKQREVFTGKVVSVADGDTLTVLVNKQQRKVRFYGVDSPEKKQPFGTKAKRFTSDAAFGKQVTVTVMSKDRYGRVVGVIHLPDGRNLNHELVRNGYAWWYKHYAPNDKELEALERRAREEKLHLWSQPDAMAPWDFRRNRTLNKQVSAR